MLYVLVSALTFTVQVFDIYVIWKHSEQLLLCTTVVRNISSMRMTFQIFTVIYITPAEFMGLSRFLASVTLPKPMRLYQ